MIYTDGMHFDNLVEIIENNFQDEELGRYRKVLNSARLFVLPAAAQDFLPKEYTDEETEWYLDNFHLPFKMTAVEDATSVVFLTRVDQNKSDAMVGQSFAWMYWSPLSSGASRDDVNYVKDGDHFHTTREKPAVRLPEYENEHPLTGSLVCGDVTIQSVNKHVLGVSGDVFGITLFSEGVFKHEHTREDITDAMIPHMIHEANVAIQQVMLINSPRRFVLESSPVFKHKRKGNRPQKVAERSKFVSLHPGEIRQILRVTKEELAEGKKLTTGHDVRAHPRTYRNERYTNMRGKTVMVPAHWCGPQERTISGRRYKVRLDM